MAAAAAADLRANFGITTQTLSEGTLPALQGPHFWDEAHSFQSYVDNFERVAAAAGADPAAISGDASSNTFSYALVGLRRAPALCPRPALATDHSRHRFQGLG